ncbi:tetraketide alpha-pyrone reductase 1-like protein [Tanacetum coccineum]
MSGEGKVVCVTGASGYIASWIVKLLLHRGYSVHATVRSLADPKKTEHLVALDGAKERLTLFEATLTEEGSFDAAIDGCVCVFHTASPVLLSVDDPHAQLVDPAVKGTLSVLKSAAKVPSLKRGVLDSSSAAVVFGAKNSRVCVCGSRDVFSDPNFVEQKKYGNMLYSKTLDRGMLAVKPTLNMTSEGFMRLIETGQEVFADGIYRLVDVRDVAIAHILAFENPEANGRYCVVGNVLHSSEIMKIVNKLYPALGHSKGYNDGKEVEPQLYSVSRVKAEGLGVEFTPVERVCLEGSLLSLRQPKKESLGNDCRDTTKRERRLKGEG